MNNPNIPTIGQKTVQRSLSEKETKMMHWQGLSQLWEHYAEMLSKGDLNPTLRMSESAYAYQKSADYVKKMIDLVEEEGNE